MNILERTARRDEIDMLAREGLLGDAESQAARQWIRSRIDWAGWLDRLLLGTGITLVIAGVLFFFAYNWASIPAFGKFALIEGGLVAAILATWRVGFSSPTGKVMMTGSSVLVGILLAVFGQVYQTGADTWQLFAGWAALIAGWVAIGRFVPLWMLFIGLLNLTVVLFFQRRISDSTVFILLGLLDTGFLFAAERGRARQVDWLTGGWHRIVLWVTAAGFLTATAFEFVVSNHSRTVPLVGFVAWVLVEAWAFAQYRCLAPELTPLAIGAASAGCVALSAFGHVVLSGRMFNEGGILITAVAAVVIAGALGAWLKHVAVEIQEVENV